MAKDKEALGQKTVNRLSNMTQVGIVGDPLPLTEDTESIAHPPIAMDHLGADAGSIFDAD
jgi:hypothetical protein